MHGHDARAPLPDRVVYADTHLSVPEGQGATMQAQRLWRLLKECGVLVEDLVVAHVNRLMADMNKMQVPLSSSCFKCCLHLQACLVLVFRSRAATTRAGVAALKNKRIFSSVEVRVEHSRNDLNVC